MSYVALKEIFLGMVGKGDTPGISDMKEWLCIFLRKHLYFFKRFILRYKHILELVFIFLPTRERHNGKNK